MQHGRAVSGGMRDSALCVVHEERERWSGDRAESGRDDWRTNHDTPRYAVAPP